MRLYLIKRRADGKFLAKVEAHYSAHVGLNKNGFSRKNFYILRSPDGVAANLRKLCSVPYYRDGDKFPYRPLRWRDFDPEKLKLYEVLTVEVDLVSMRATPAHEFIQIDAIRNAPLTWEERRSA